MGKPLHWNGYELSNCRDAACTMPTHRVKPTTPVVADVTMDPPTGTDVVTKSSVDDAVTIVDDDARLPVTCTRYRLAGCRVLAAMNAF